MRKNNLEFPTMIEHLFLQEFMDESNPKPVKTITFQVTESCSLRCTYCYEINKCNKSMDFETAKKMINYLFDNRKDPNFYFSENTTAGLVIDFIGGEPLLEIDLISQIADYFELKFLENLDCPWSFYHSYSISSNGVAYFNPKVQEFLKKYDGSVSIGITVDGCKELHDKCRLFPDGSGSYDLAIAAALDQLHRGNELTKITLSPENIDYLYDGIVNMTKLGFTQIMANCAFEEGWQLKDAQKYYHQLIRIADYFVKNNLQDSIYFCLFDNGKYHFGTNDVNWCGSTKSMLGVDNNGVIYPCVRFMPTSLGSDVEPYALGTIEHGIGITQKEKDRLKMLETVTKSSQSTQECLDCPIESGCSWCSAYNYQKFGTINKRATYICQMHKAAALATKYFYKLCRDKESYDMTNVTEEIALEIIGQEEWDKIKDF